MDITLELVKVVLVSIALAFGYNIVRYAAKLIETGEKWDLLKFIPTAIYSVVLGLILALSGLVNLNDLTNFEQLFDAKWALYLSFYSMFLYFWESVVVPFIKGKLTVTESYPITAGIDPLNKMNPETRKWLVSDRTEDMGRKVLAAVDDAQSKSTIRYSINSGPWEYLIEYGIVTGGKHYLYKFWDGNGEVLWKSISSMCLEAIRKTGKWPDYDKLY
jgi:hypothetical protein